MPRIPRPTTSLACAGVLALALAALTGCGGDDGDGAAPASTAGAAGGGAGGDLTAYCDAATAVAEYDGFPTAELIDRYLAVAPAEVRPSAEVVAAALTSAPEGDVVAAMAATAEDRVEEEYAVMTAFESERCGIETQEPPLPEGAVRSSESGTRIVTIGATDYAFSGPETIPAGRTTFVLENSSAKEAHHLALAALAEGTTVEQALAAEDGSGFRTVWSTNAAAPETGGDVDLEQLTFDVEPGTYAMLCFLPGPTGLPHVAMGMRGSLVVT